LSKREAPEKKAGMLSIGAIAPEVLNIAGWMRRP